MSALPHTALLAGWRSAVRQDRHSINLGWLDTVVQPSRFIYGLGDRLDAAFIYTRSDIT